MGGGLGDRLEGKGGRGGGGGWENLSVRWSQRDRGLTVQILIPIDATWN